MSYSEIYQPPWHRANEKASRQFWLNPGPSAIMEASMHNLGILLSGRGSNFEAIARNIEAGEIPGVRIAVVISNKSGVGGIETARGLGLSTAVIPSKGKAREEHDREIVAVLQEHKVDLVCLA